MTTFIYKNSGFMSKSPIPIFGNFFLKNPKIFNSIAQITRNPLLNWFDFNGQFFGWKRFHTCLLALILTVIFTFGSSSKLSYFHTSAQNYSDYNSNLILVTYKSYPNTRKYHISFDADFSDCFFTNTFLFGSHWYKIDRYHGAKHGGAQIILNQIR